MGIHSQRFGVYIVRIWQEPSEGGGVWRASALDTVTKERVYFATKTRLLEFLCLQDNDTDLLPDESNLEAWSPGDITP